ncbi:FAD-binding oxidoreductase [Pseudactinotalea sp. HY158]|uniref:FAD-binding oxidoreductase n=1 Tax=Pseudactinotalea sp. HY158 TaxID=2654547 RepID=UPI00129CF6CF|nr:FAD-linked oxidase C-terminal domain-containing protein [Pseudactinotalea sp. HY158]QGH68258.1 FAD-binding protein [Pseudactinotalea sp. HY158]
MTTSGAGTEDRPDDRLAALRRALPGVTVLGDLAAREAHRWDRALDPNAGMPAAVLLPRSTEQVQQIVRHAAGAGIAIVPRGAGSGLSGGASAVDGALVVSMAEMTGLEIDPVTRMAFVEPGVINADLKRACAEVGLWYPPDPASVEFSTIGGNVATNAGGLCCVKYGVTTDYVLGLTVVLADGTAVDLGGPRLKEAAGLSLTKLFVGSEGTLGIITGIVLRLVPPPPPACTAVATFADLEAACAAVLRVAGAVRASMLEFMDHAAIEAVEDVHAYGLDRAAQAMLIAQSDQPGEAGTREIEQIAAIFREFGATEVLVTDDAETGEAYTAARRAAIPAVERTGRLLLGDVGVPLPQLGALVTGIDAIATRNGVTISVIAHAGDGNTHPLVVFDPADSSQAARAEAAYGEVMDLAIGLGGTITGEHGVGRTKKAWLPGYVGPDVMRLNKTVKDALDPHGLLNPGAIL